MSKWSNKEDRDREIARLKEERKGVFYKSKEYRRISSQIDKLTKYEKRLELKRTLNTKYRKQRKALLSPKPQKLKKAEPINVRALTPIEREVLEIKRREHPMVFKPNKNTKYIIGERMVIRKCDKCGKELDDCYSTFKLMEENKYYCENCKTSEMYKLGL